MQEKIAKWQELMGDAEISDNMRYHLDLHRDSDSESDDDDDAKLEERKIRREYRGRKSKFLQGLFWSAHQRFFRSLCIASKVDKAIEIGKKALADGNCCVIGLQSTGEARSKGAAKAAGFGDNEGGDFDDFVSAPNEDLKRIIMMMFPLPPKPAGVKAPGKHILSVELCFLFAFLLLRAVINSTPLSPLSLRAVFLNNAAKKSEIDEDDTSMDIDGGSDVENDNGEDQDSDDEAEVVTTRSGRATKRMTYAESDSDDEVPKKKRRNSKKKSSKTASKGKKKASRTDSDTEDFELDDDDDDDDDEESSFMGDTDDDNDDDAQGKRRSKRDKNPKPKKRSKSKKSDSSNKIAWDEIDLDLDVTGNVRNERLVNYRKAVENIKKVS